MLTMVIQKEDEIIHVQKVDLPHNLHVYNTLTIEINYKIKSNILSCGSNVKELNK